VTSAAAVRNIMQAAKPNQAVAFQLMRNTGGKWSSLHIAGTLSAEDAQR